MTPSLSRYPALNAPVCWNEATHFRAKRARAVLSSGSKGSGPSSAVGEMSSTSPAVRSLEKLDNYVRESHSSIRILCAQFDTSGDGLLSHSELEAALGSLLTANEIKGLIEFLDAGHDGTIDL